MTIYGIKGRPRSGKTALGVKMLTNHWRIGYCPVTNVPIDFYKNEENYDIESEWQKPIPLNIHDINKAIDKETTINELYEADLVCIYASEFMQYAFSRKSSSNTNALLAYMLSQLGKTSTTFIADYQLAHTVDVIFRELCEYEIGSYKLTYSGEYEGKIYNNCLAGFHYVLEDKSNLDQKPYEFYWPIENALSTLNTYDSNKPYKADVLQLKVTMDKIQSHGQQDKSNNSLSHTQEQKQKKVQVF